MAYSSSPYPTSGLDAFVTGGLNGYSTGLELIKKTNELKNSIEDRQLIKEANDAKDKAVGLDSQDYGGESTTLPKIEGGGVRSGTGSDTGGGTGGYDLEGGKGGAIKAYDLYTYLVDNGASKNEATLLTSAAQSESDFNPDLTHDGGIGYGLFGHNQDRLANMRKAAGVGPSALVPWQSQAIFALQELRSRPEGAEVDKATTADQLAKLQFRYEVPQGASNPTSAPSWNRRLSTTQAYMDNPPSLGGAPTTTATTAQPSTTAATGYGTQPAPTTGQTAALAPGYVMPSDRPGGITGQLGGAAAPSTAYGGGTAPAAPTTTGGGTGRTLDAPDLSGPEGPTARTVRPQAAYGAPVGAQAAYGAQALVPPSGPLAALMNRPQAPPPPSTLMQLADAYSSAYRNPTSAGAASALIPAKSGLFG